MIRSDHVFDFRVPSIWQKIVIIDFNRLNWLINRQISSTIEYYRLIDYIFDDRFRSINHWTPVTEWRHNGPTDLALHRLTSSTTVNATSSCMEQSWGRLFLLLSKKLWCNTRRMRPCHLPKTIPLWLHYVDDTFTAVHKDKHYSLDSEDDFRSGCWKVSH